MTDDELKAEYIAAFGITLCRAGIARGYQQATDIIPTLEQINPFCPSGPSSRSEAPTFKELFEYQDRKQTAREKTRANCLRLKSRTSRPSHAYIP